MGVNNSPAATVDVAAICDAAIASERGVRVACDSEKHAMRLRHRCNAWRKRERQENKTVYEPGSPEYGKSAYDCLYFRIEGKDLVAERVSANMKMEPL